MGKAKQVKALTMAELSLFRARVPVWPGLGDLGWGLETRRSGPGGTHVLAVTEEQSDGVRF